MYVRTSVSKVSFILNVYLVVLAITTVCLDYLNRARERESELAVT